MKVRWQMKVRCGLDFYLPSNQNTRPDRQGGDPRAYAWGAYEHWTLTLSARSCLLTRAVQNHRAYAWGAYGN